MANPGHFLCCCSSDYATHFCVCGSQATLLCKAHAETHIHKSENHPFTNLFPIIAYRRCTDIRYLERLDKRVTTMKAAVMQLRSNLDLVEKCKVQILLEVKSRIEALTAYLLKQMSELESIKQEMSAVIEEGVREAEQWIWKDRVLLKHPLAIVIRYFDKYSDLTSLFDFDIKKEQLPEFSTFTFTPPQAMEDPDSYKGQPEKAEDEAKKRLSELSKDLRSSEELAGVYEDLARALLIQGRISDCLSSLEKAWEVNEKLSKVPSRYMVMNIAMIIIQPCNDRIDKSLQTINEFLKLLKKHQVLHDEVGSKYCLIAVIQYALGNYEKAISSSNKAFAFYQKFLPSNHEMIGSQFLILSYLHLCQFHFSEALDFGLKAVKINEEILSANHPHLAYSYLHLSDVYICQFRFDIALRYANAAEQICQDVLQSAHIIFSRIAISKALVLIGQGHNTEALNCLETALERHTENIPLITIKMYHLISIAKLKLYHPAEALNYCEKAQKIQRESLPVDHVINAETYHIISMIYSAQCETDRAHDAIMRAMKIQEAKSYFNQQITTITYSGISEMLCQQGRYSEGLYYAEKMLRNAQELYLPAEYFIIAYCSMALIFLCEQKVEAALDLLGKIERLSNRFEIQMVKPKLLQLWGYAYLQQGQYEQAVCTFHRALGMYKQQLSSLDTASIYLGIAYTHGHQGRMNEALLHAGKALEIQQLVLPPNHVIIAISYASISAFYSGLASSMRL